MSTQPLGLIDNWLRHIRDVAPVEPRGARRDRRFPRRAIDRLCRAQRRGAGRERVPHDDRPGRVAARADGRPCTAGSTRCATACCAISGWWSSRRSRFHPSTGWSSEGVIASAAMELRALTVLDSLQPQLTGFLQTVCAGLHAARTGGGAVHRDRARHRDQPAHRRGAQGDDVPARHADRRARLRDARAARQRQGAGRGRGRRDPRAAWASSARTASSRTIVSSQIITGDRRPPEPADQPDAPRRHDHARARRCTSSRCTRRPTRRSRPTRPRRPRTSTCSR